MTDTIARIYVAELVPYLALAAVFTSAFGALGAAIVWSLRLVVDALVFSWCAVRAGKLRLSPLSSRKYASAAGLVVLGAALFALSSLFPGLAGRLGCAILLVPIYTLVVWALVLTPRERAGVRALGTHMIPALGKILGR